MKFFAYDYKGNKKIGEAFCEFDYLKVDVVSGDEHVYAFKNGGTGQPPTCVGYVSGGSAAYTEYEGTYYVGRDEVEEWLTRGDSYYYLYEKPYEDLETSDE